MLVKGKQPTKTPPKICARSNGSIKSYGPSEPVLWSSQWYDPNGHRRRGVGIPCYSMENSLRKLLKKFGRNTTVGSKVMDLFNRYSGGVGGTTRTDIVSVE